MRNGVAFPLRPLVRLTRDGDCLLLLIGDQVLWQFTAMSATPRPCSGKRSSGANRTELMKFAKLMHPTPTVNGNNNREGASKNAGNGLTTALLIMHPTPRAGDGRDNAGGTNSRRSAKARGVLYGRALNPEYVEALMGFPRVWTELPIAFTGSDALAMPSSHKSPSTSAAG